jgi:RimJ/RimL family protein N-acetyltransferase
MARTRHWLERAIAEREVVARAIVLEGIHVGNVVLDQLDRCARSARLSIYIGEASARGRGVGQWAVREAVRLAFDALGLERVWLTVRHDNAAARRAYEHAGFAAEPAAAWASDDEQGASLQMSRRAR